MKRGKILTLNSKDINKYVCFKSVSENNISVGLVKEVDFSFVGDVDFQNDELYEWIL